MNQNEEFLTRILSCLAEQFKNQLVLKGGMLLRLYNSPRATQDLDYYWVRTKKRNFLADEIKEKLETLDGVKVENIRLNSRGIFLSVKNKAEDMVAKIEINVVSEAKLAPKPMSTDVLANRYQLKPQLIASMDLKEAFAHKIAASIERRLVRDLYDLVQMEPLTAFDPDILQERLDTLTVLRAKPRKTDFKEAAALLQKRVDDLDERKIIEELAGSLLPEQLPGLLTVIRATVFRIIQRMEVM